MSPEHLYNSVMTELSPDQIPDGWSALAEAYDDGVAGFTAKFARDGADLAGITDGTRVLDVAAGTGAFAFEAARRGARVLATDFAPGMVAYLASLVKQRGLDNVTVREMDGQNLDVEAESFADSTGVFNGV